MSRKLEARKAFEDFPEELVPEGEWEALYEEEYRCGVGGVDEQGRLVSFSDDGWVVGQVLEDADVERTIRGSTGFDYKLDAERETISSGQHGPEFMLDRDVSDWVWVNPRYEYLTEGFER